MRCPFLLNWRSAKFGVSDAIPEGHKFLLGGLPQRDSLDTVGVVLWSPGYDEARSNYAESQSKDSGDV